MRRRRSRFLEQSCGDGEDNLICYSNIAIRGIWYQFQWKYCFDSEKRYCRYSALLNRYAKQGELPLHLYHFGSNVSEVNRILTIIIQRMLTKLQYICLVSRSRIRSYRFRSRRAKTTFQNFPTPIYFAPIRLVTGRSAEPRWADIHGPRKWCPEQLLYVLCG